MMFIETLSKHDYAIWLLAGVAIGFFVFDDSAKLEQVEQKLRLIENPPVNAEDFQKRKLDAFFNQFVHNEGIKREKIYGPLFMEWGLDQRTVEDYFERTKDIFKKSLQTEAAIKNVIMARQAFERKMKEEMGKEIYERYREHELMSPALGECDRFNSYLTSMGVPELSGDEKAATVVLMRDADVATEGTWHGPFDRLPEPQIGAEAIANHEERLLAKWSEGFESMISRAGDSGVSAESISHLRNYYQKTFDGMRGSIANLRRPEEERERDAAKRFAELKRGDDSPMTGVQKAN